VPARAPRAVHRLEPLVIGLARQLVEVRDATVYFSPERGLDGRFASAGFCHLPETSGRSVDPAVLRRYRTIFLRSRSAAAEDQCAPYDSSSTYPVKSPPACAKNFVMTDPVFIGIFLELWHQRLLSVRVAFCD
jgi:hypothetical protein